MCECSFFHFFLTVLKNECWQKKIPGQSVRDFVVGYYSEKLAGNREFLG